MPGGGQSGVRGPGEQQFPLDGPNRTHAAFPHAPLLPLVKILLASAIFRYPQASDGQIIVPDPKRLSA